MARAHGSTVTELYRWDGDVQGISPVRLGHNSARIPSGNGGSFKRYTPAIQAGVRVTFVESHVDEGGSRSDDEYVSDWFWPSEREPAFPTI